MIANIAPEILDMIVLSVMRNAVLRCSLIARILIGLGPRLDNREHQDRKTARAKYRSEEHTSELQSLMRISYAVFCLKKKNTKKQITKHTYKIHTDIISNNNYV